MPASRRGLAMGRVRSLFSDGTACGLTDAELLARFATRDGETSEFAFAVLVERHGPMVLRVCATVLGDAHAAEDAFQAAFLVLARRARLLRGGAPLAPWLHQVAWRTASRLRGRIARRKRRELSAARVISSATEDRHGVAELGEVLHAELGRLPAKYRIPIVLCYLEAMTSEQAARQLGWPAGTVRSRLARGRARLRARLTRRGLAPSAALVVAGLSSMSAEASVPQALAEMTARAAVLFAKTRNSAGAISATAANIFTEVLRSMALFKLRTTTAVVALGLTTTVWALGQFRDLPGSTLLITAANGPRESLAAGNESTRQSRAQASRVDETEWARILAELADADRRELRVDVWAIGSKLAQLPPDDGISLLTANWEKLNRAETRQQLLSAWYHTEPYPLHPRNHPRLLDALDLGVRDRSPAVQNWALGILRWVAFQDFAEDRQAYEPWYKANRQKPLATVIADSVKRLVVETAQARGIQASNAAQLLSDNRATFRDVPVARQAAVDAGLLRILERWTAAGSRVGATESNGELAVQALGVILLLKPDEPYLQRVVVPLLARNQPIKLRAAALRTLGDKGNGWAVDLLLELLKCSLEEKDPHVFSSLIWAAASALAEIDDPKAVPIMIAVIDADNTSETVYGIGHFGLGPLTGVRHDENHNGPWWRAWWDKNKARYPKEVRCLEVPKLTRNLQGGLAGAASIPES